jgi:hypothetical protein
VAHLSFLDATTTEVAPLLRSLQGWERRTHASEGWKFALASVIGHPRGYAARGILNGGPLPARFRLFAADAREA